MILADTKALREEVAMLRAAALLMTTPQEDQQVSALEAVVKTLSTILDAIGQLQDSVAALHTREAEVKLGRALREIMSDRD
jgi:hypothetical protein